MHEPEILGRLLAYMLPGPVHRSRTNVILDLCKNSQQNMLTDLYLKQINNRNLKILPDYNYNM